MALIGTRAIVTGASSGIGRAVAAALAASGAEVLATARRAERLRELAQAHPAVRWVAMDATEPGFAERLFDEADRQIGGCDVAVNNAGVMVAGPCDRIDLDRVSQMVRVNVEAAYRVALFAARRFKAQGRGHLVNLSSVLGTKIRPTAGAYAGTKHAIEALSEDLRIELAGSGAKVTCIEPGLVSTELHAAFEVHPRESLGVRTPLEPEDVARCVLWALEQPPHVSIARLMVLPADHAI
ncbi:MAG: SDR family oxidoreductase [Fimbriimonadales bacterium]|nr:SDR family oxidoreductase [Fimbriimonadales bacterium]